MRLASNTDISTSSIVEPENEDDPLRRQHPFAARSIRQCRLIWDPSAHRYFGEECSFFFIRFRETHGSQDLNPLRRVDSWLNQFQIRSKYVYVLFGYYDALVRVWALPTRLTNFRNYLRSQTNEILAVKELSVTHCRLLLNPNIVDDDQNLFRTIQSSLPLIRTANTINEGLINEDQTAALQDLIQQQLLHIVRPTKAVDVNSKCFRFAIVIKLDDLQGAKVSLTQLVEFVKDYNNKSQELGITRCGIYQGGGFGDFLVSGLVSDHDSLINFSSALMLRFQALDVHCRTETHITAGSESSECDVVDPAQPDAVPAEARMLNFLCSQQIPVERLAHAIYAMSTSAHQSLLETFTEHELDFVSSDFGIYFKDFLLARALGDQRYLQRALTCLLELEGLLSELWLKRCIASNAQGDAIKMANAVGFNKVDLKKLTLRHMTDITEKLVSEGHQDWVRTTLGLDWLAVLRELSEFRNDVAHGKLFVQPEYLTKNWDSLATRIGILGNVYNKLRTVTVSNC